MHRIAHTYRKRTNGCREPGSGASIRASVLSACPFPSPTRPHRLCSLLIPRTPTPQRAASPPPSISTSSQSPPASRTQRSTYQLHLHSCTSSLSQLAQMSDGGEFVELLWENGQAVVHGRKKHQQAAFPPFGFGGGNSSSSRGAAQERHLGGGGDATAVFAKTGGGFGGMGMAGSGHDFGGGFHSAAHDNGDDDTVPWIHYPIIEDDDSGTPALAADYCSDFFSELQAAAAAASAAPTDPGGSLPPSNNGAATNHRSAPVATGCRELPRESRGLSIPTTRAELQPAELAAAAKQHRPGGAGVMNFSLFSRPAAMAKASLQSAQRPQGADKVSNATGSNRMESTVVQAASVPRNAPVFADKRAAWPPQQPKDVRFAPTPMAAASPTTATAGNLHQEMARDKVGHSHSMPAHKDEARKAPDATVATSSVCSGNGVGIDEPWHQQKRKSHAECSASQDDDLDDDYGGALRRSAAARGTKRSRTAEVHNLSERRRRDRINEKMRALQELIPNCNKIDKASMLDEAIEYLKTLQLQVQMMSMGTGLCIPPMLLPPALQHLQIPPMAHFPHLAMGLGYGMGVFDMNHSGGAIPIPPMPGAHFPYPMMPGAAPQGFGIPGTNTAPMFGIPGQTIPSSSAQPFASLGNLPVRPNMVTQVSGAMANMVQHQQQQGISNQQQQCLNKEVTTSDPQMQIIMQGENQHFRIPSSEQTNSSQFSDGSGKGDTLHGGMGLKHKVGR